MAARDRYPWHACPCCVGNIPRTLLMIPTWTYAKGNDGIYVNLFIGSTINVENIAGTDIEMVQKTDYPWSGKVAITVNPKAAEEVSRSTSAFPIAPRANSTRRRRTVEWIEFARRQRRDSSRRKSRRVTR